MLVTKENIFLFITFQGTGNMQKKKSHAAYSKMFVNIFFKRVARVEAHSFPQDVALGNLFASWNR